MGMTQQKSPFLLCILDGVGLSPRTEGNAVAQALTPTLDHLFATCPHSTLLTHAEHVGLPHGQMGNSEVGHMAIGAGRVLLQPLAQIQHDLDSATFTQKQEWQNFLKDAESAPTIHVVGLTSTGGVHSHKSHIEGILKALNAAGKRTALHAITDGRDTSPTAALEELPQLGKVIDELEHVELATLCGRYTAMDRDKRWERTLSYYNLLTKGEGVHAKNISEALKFGYANNASGDEFLQATTLTDTRIEKGDAVLFVNFRADRMRQIVRLFMDEKQNPHLIPLRAIGTLTPYDESLLELNVPHFHVLYPPRSIENTLGEVLSARGLTQLRIAETEKYPHVSYFFSGGREELFTGETRKLIPSPQVVTYDLQPEMSLPEVTGTLIKELTENTPDFIVLNMANGDMVGHTGDMTAAIKAVEAVDNALAQILSTLENVGGEALILADHGNAEELLTEDGHISTSHSLNPVPCIYVGKKPMRLQDGTLIDVAPTVLGILGIAQPKEMTGSCLIS